MEVWRIGHVERISSLSGTHSKAPVDGGQGVARPWYVARSRADVRTRRGGGTVMSAPLRPCLVCGRPSGGARCSEHAIPRRGWAHERASRQVRFEELSCWICGQPAKPGDPLTGDHIVPRIHGGQDVRENLRAAHRSCNSRRGAGGGGYIGIEGNAGGRLTPLPRRPKVSLRGFCEHRFFC